MKKSSLFLALLASAAIAYAGPRKLSRDLQGVDPARPVDVIVQFKDPPAEKQKDKVKKRRGAFRKDLNVIKAGVYTVPAGELDGLADDPDIAFISPNREIYPTLDVSRPALGADLAARYGYNGSGIGVAVIDSGISLVSDLYRRVVYSESFVGLSANEAYGHGTHVAGIIAGSGTGSYGKYRGLAPGANLINLRVLDDNGVGADAALIDAINRAIELKYRYNIRVINLSVGRPVYESYLDDPLCQAVEQAWKAGIVVVVAAGNFGRETPSGNQGYGTITSPGNDPLVITVGAMKTGRTPARGDDVIASYSSKGPTAIDHILKPDLVAAGNRIISVSAKGESKLEQQYPNNKVGSLYFELSGTSMAAPMVSAAAALLLEKDPRLTPDQVKARLMRTASKSFPASTTATDPATGATYVSSHDIFTVGAGYLDIAAALVDSTTVRGGAASPAVVFDPVTNTVSLLQASGVVWGTGIVWGTGVVWGTNVVSSTGICWGTGVVWGTGGDPSGTAVVWGTGVVWGGDTARVESLRANGEK